jgi:peptidyl-tRNA hydrolase
MVRILAFAFVMLLTANCKRKQWNLNQTIGWGQPKIEVSIVFIRPHMSCNEKGTSLVTAMRRIENEIQENLVLHHFGDEIENDFGDQQRLFMIKKDHRPALQIIKNSIEENSLYCKIEICERNFEADKKLRDTVIYP